MLVVCLCRGIARAVRSVARSPLSISQSVAAGVVRWTLESIDAGQRQALARRALGAEGSAASVVAARFRRTNQDEDRALDRAFDELRAWRGIAASLAELDVELLEPRVRTPAVKWGVGQVLRHRLHGRCVVYGWEATSVKLRQARADATLVDNRLCFAGGFDPGLEGTDVPHYRCLFDDGTARVCNGDALVDAGYTADLVDIKGATCFFDASRVDRRSLKPRPALAALYPNDADFVDRAQPDASTAVYARQWLQSWQALGRDVGRDAFAASSVAQPRSSSQPPHERDN